MFKLKKWQQRHFIYQNAEEKHTLLLHTKMHSKITSRKILSFFPLLFSSLLIYNLISLGIIKIMNEKLSEIWIYLGDFKWILMNPQNFDSETDMMGLTSHATFLGSGAPGLGGQSNTGCGSCQVGQEVGNPQSSCLPLHYISQHHLILGHGSP